MGLWNGECSNVPWRWHTWESLRKAVFPMMLSFSCLAARLPSAYTAPFWAIFSQGYRAFCAKKKVTSKRAELDMCPLTRPLCGAYTLNSGWGMQRALNVFFSPWVTWDGLQGGRRDSHRISGDIWVVLLGFAHAPDETSQWHAGASSELWPREIPPLSLRMTYFAKWQSRICHSTRQTGRWFSSPVAWSLFSSTTLQGSLLKSSYLLVFMHEMSETLAKCLLFSMCIFFFKTLAPDTSWNYWYEALNLYNGAVFWSLTPRTSILLTRWSCSQSTGWSSH